MRHLDPADPVVNAAVFGKQVEDFIRSDIGTYLIKKCTGEENEAVERLVERAHVMSHEEVLAEQSIIARSRGFRDWLGYAVQDGLQALTMLEGEE
jgi:hypothetical protein